jgi:hypothetical protein
VSGGDPWSANLDAKRPPNWVAFSCYFSLFSEYQIQLENLPNLWSVFGVQASLNQRSLLWIGWLELDKIGVYGRLLRILDWTVNAAVPQDAVP